MNVPAIAIAIALLAAAVPAAQADTYSLSPAGAGEAGSTGSSASYSAVLSITTGAAGSSPDYSTRTGFAGRLPDPSHLALSSPSGFVDEGATIQLAVSEHFDDTTRAPLHPDTVTWSVQSGPVSALSPAGLLAAAPVYTDTPAVIAATAGVTGSLGLTVRDVFPDNFSSYAADGLPDSWQVQYFGIDSLNAGLHADHDSDSADNLLEFAFGTNPASPAAGIALLEYAGTFAGNGTIIRTGFPVTRLEPVASGLDYRVLFVRRRDYATARLAYSPQYSNDLAAWTTTSVEPVVLADDGVHQIVSVPWLNFIRGRKVRFFRLTVTLLP